jgi:hypothetical protein
MVRVAMFRLSATVPLTLCSSVYMLMDTITNDNLSHQHLQIAEDYSHCEILLRLPGYCPSMCNCIFNLFLSKIYARLLSDNQN